MIFQSRADIPIKALYNFKKSIKYNAKKWKNSFVPTSLLNLIFQVPILGTTWSVAIFFSNLEPFYFKEAVHKARHLHFEILQIYVFVYFAWEPFFILQF